MLPPDILQNGEFETIYFQTNPTYIKSPIHIPKSTIGKPDTVKIRHFFALLHQDLVVLGLEVFVYLQIYSDFVEKYVYVSKCDTVGLEKSTIKIGKVIGPVLQYIINYNGYKIKMKNLDEKSKDLSDPSTLVRLQRLRDKLPDIYPNLPYYNDIPPKEECIEYRTLPKTQNLRLCVFTKPAKEYLFPNSAKNPYKNLLNGQSLLRWWISIIDSITKGWNNHKLMIPGADKYATRKFIEKYSDWSEGHIFKKDGLAVQAIPLFPDDPKGRFLELVIVECRYGKMTVSRFHQELAYRQEFLLGDCVSLIGCCKENLEVTYHDDLVSTVTISEYKEFMNLLKLVDFSDRVEVSNFVSNYRKSK